MCKRDALAMFRVPDSPFIAGSEYPPSVILSEGCVATESKFCVVKLQRRRNGAKPPQAGSAMGFLNVCLPWLHFLWTVEDACAYKILLSQVGVS